MTSAPAIPMSPAADEHGDANCGLRERKKRETRRSIHRAALELAHAGGTEALTVDAIAERAGVSARTFFNYFPAKDDALVGADPEDLDTLRRAVADRPAAESPREVVRVLVQERVAALELDREMWDMRRDLTQREPALGLRVLGVYARADRAVVDAITERARTAAGHLSPDEELAVAVEAYAALAAFRAAVRSHLSQSSDASFAELVDRAFALLEPTNAAAPVT